MENRPVPRPVDLDTMPFAGMMLLLIPMLLASAQFASIATIDSTLPATVVGPPASKEPLNLTVAVHATGFTVSADEDALARLGWDGARELPLASRGGYDFRGLTELASQVKALYPSHDDLILTPADDVSFAVVVDAMDATRTGPDGAELFPGVLLGSVM